MIREELILQYFNNQLSVSDRELVMEWAAEYPVDFQLSKEIWEHSSHAKDIKIFNVEDEWSSFMDAIDLQESSNEEFTTPDAEHQSDKLSSGNQEAKVISISRWKEWRPVVATAAMFILVAAAYFLWPRNSEILYLSSNDTKEVELSDKTIVQVQAGSSIRYLKSFDGEDKRIVHLDGIATFDIAYDPEHPFVVQTHNSGVKALGTVFIVDGSSKEQTGVENIEGLIRFFDIKVEDKFKDVKEGESFVYDGSDFVETTIKPEPRIRRFEALAIPKSPSPTVAQVVNYLYRISNGHTVHKGDDFDWNRRVDINMNSTNVDVILNRLGMKASVVKVKKNCSDCYEIKSIRIR